VTTLGAGGQSACSGDHYEVRDEKDYFDDIPDEKIPDKNA
jgi:hypothetical protein